MRSFGYLLLPYVISLVSVLSNTASADEYYRWIDDNGTLNISDVPPNISLEFNVDINIIPLPKNSSLNNVKAPNIPPEPQTPDVPQNATAIRLVSPSEEDTIRSNEGIISIKVDTDFPLGKNQLLRLVLDDEKLASQTSSSWQLNNIDRGSHTLKVQLLQDGKIIAKTHSITIFLHRAIQHKALATGKPTP